METFLNRISVIAENEGITITALEKKIGASRGVLSRAVLQNTDIQSKWLISIIENYRHYDANWLLLGDGKMFRNDFKSENRVQETESAYKKSIKIEDLNNKSNIELINIIKKLVETNDQNSRIISSFIMKFCGEDLQTNNNQQK